MNTNPTTKFASSGAVSQEGKLPVAYCRHCGTEVVWVESRKTGKKYPVNVHHFHDSDALYYRKDHLHQCTDEQRQSYIARQAEEAIERQDRIAAGEIVKGAMVEIVKGRKFPIGTTGRVFWIASQPDSYGVTKLGMMVGEEKLWVNVENVRSIAG
jgi:hypothetical protein